MIYYIVVLSDGQSTEIMEPVVDRGIEVDRQFFEKRYSGWLSIGYQVQHFCRSENGNFKDFDSQLSSSSDSSNISCISIY